MKRDKRETLKQYQLGVMLADDEANHVHRIRASKEVHAWLKTMTAEQRGELLAKAYAQEKATDVTPDASGSTLTITVPKVFRPRKPGERRTLPPALKERLDAGYDLSLSDELNRILKALKDNPGARVERHKTHWRVVSYTAPGEAKVHQEGILKRDLNALKKKKRIEMNSEGHYVLKSLVL